MSYLIMIDFEQSCAAADTIEHAREIGAGLLAREPLACSMQIFTDDGEFLEDIGATDGTWTPAR